MAICISTTIRKVKDTATRWFIATARFLLQFFAYVSLFAALIAVAYLISEPFYTSHDWYIANNIFPRAVLLVVARSSQPLPTKFERTCPSRRNVKNPNPYRERSSR